MKLFLVVKYWLKSLMLFMAPLSSIRVTRAHINAVGAEKALQELERVIAVDRLIGLRVREAVSHGVSLRAAVRAASMREWRKSYTLIDNYQDVQCFLFRAQEAQRRLA